MYDGDTRRHEQRQRRPVQCVRRETRGYAARIRNMYIEYNWKVMIRRNAYTRADINYIAHTHTHRAQGRPLCECVCVRAREDACFAYRIAYRAGRARRRLSETTAMPERGAGDDLCRDTRQADDRTTRHAMPRNKVVIASSRCVTHLRFSADLES